MALPEQIQHIQDPSVHAAFAGIHLVHRATRGDVEISDDIKRAATNDAANVFALFPSTEAVVSAYQRNRTPSLRLVSGLVRNPDSLAEMVEGKQALGTEVLAGIYLEGNGSQVADRFIQTIHEEPDVPAEELETVRFMRKEWGLEVGIQETTLFPDTSTTVFEEDPDTERIIGFVEDFTSKFPFLLDENNNGDPNTVKQVLIERMGINRHIKTAIEQGVIDPKKTLGTIDLTLKDLTLLRYFQYARGKGLPMKRELQRVGSLVEKIIQDRKKEKEVN